MSRPALAAERASVAEPPDVRQRILDTASTLFYERGVRAVGVDLVVAFLQREDVSFWSQWDEVSARHAGDPVAELEAHLRWVAKRLARANYRGCPQINVAAEFAEAGHPARGVSRQHMQALRKRLTELARTLGAARPAELGAQLGLLINGAFVSSSMIAPDEATRVLLACGRALLAAAK